MRRILLLTVVVLAGCCKPARPSQNLSDRDTDACENRLLDLSDNSELTPYCLGMAEALAYKQLMEEGSK